jgi:hypothetical protein
MTSLALVLMMQFVVSTKAGLVNYVQGSANIKATASIPAGAPIETGPGGAVEILLNPGSFLRLGGNSGAVLDQVELTNMAVRITHGSAVIEAKGFEKNSPLRVTAGNRKIDIISDGIYSITDGTISVVDGKIRDADTGAIYKKGYELSDNGAVKTKFAATPLDIWSRKRSERIAAANVNIANSLRNNPNVPLNVWLWAPAFGAFVYMPPFGYRSPYGYSYRSPVDYYRVVRPAQSASSGSASSASSGSSAPAQTAPAGGGTQRPPSSPPRVSAPRVSHPPVR